MGRGSSPENKQGNQQVHLCPPRSCLEPPSEVGALQPGESGKRGAACLRVVEPASLGAVPV